MALIMQPSWLPEPLRDGFGFQHINPKVESTFISGRSLPRRGYTSTPTRVNVGWLFRDQEAALFESWFRNVLTDGVAWFAMKLRTPLGVDYYKARFVGIYEGPNLTPQANLWSVTAEMELFQRPLLASGWVEYPEGYLGRSIIDYAANREWPRP